MRIAVFHNLPSGGGKRALYEWLRRLTKEHRLDVYTLSTADHEYADIRPFVDNHCIYDFFPHELYKSPFGRLNQLQRRRDLDELMAIEQQIGLEIDQNDYDILFTNTCIYTFSPLVVQFVKTKSVYYLHEPFGRKFTRIFDRPYQRKNRLRAIVDYFDPLIRYYNHRLDTLQINSIQNSYLIANSNFTKQQMEKSFNVDAPVCPYGVDIESFYPMPEIPKGNFVLSVGELSPRKGFDFLVKSLAAIPEKIRPELVLACNRVDLFEQEYIASLASNNNIRIRILTNLNTVQLRELYNSALFCVYAPVLEPFGLVPLEAMACGSAVIGVREGGVAESILHEQTGLLVERDETQFAEATYRLLENPDQAVMFGKAGREYVEQYWTWDRSVAILEKYLVDRVGGSKLHSAENKIRI